MNSKLMMAMATSAVAVSMGAMLWAQSPISVQDAIKPIEADIESSQKPEAEAPATQPAKAAGEKRTTDSGLQIIDTGKATAPVVAESGDVVFVHYTGKLENGTKFDSSLDRGQPLPFRIGQGSVIKGWEEGIQGMAIGDKRQLIIPPDLGYGAQGAGEAIPPNATLIFDVELVGLAKGVK